MHPGIMFLLPLLASADPNADALVKKGVGLRRSGDDAGALVFFQRAAALEPNPRVTAQIGMAEHALGLWVEAERHLLSALGAVRDLWIQRHRQALETSLKIVRDHLGWLELRDVDDATTLRIDGEPQLLDRASPITPVQRVRVTAGPHLIATGTAAEGPTEAITLNVAPYGQFSLSTQWRVRPTASARSEGDDRMISSAENQPNDPGAHTIADRDESTKPSSVVAPMPPPLRFAPRGDALHVPDGRPFVAPAPSTSTVPHPNRIRTAAWIATSMAAGSVLLGAYWGYEALDAKRQRDQYTCGELDCDPAGPAHDRRARGMATRSTASFALAGALAIGAGLLWIEAGRHDNTSAIEWKPVERGALLSFRGLW